MNKFFRCGPLSAVASDGRCLFEDVTILLEQSTLTLLKGPSGCGKTTLLRMIAGLLPAHGAERVLADDIFPENRLPEWRSRVLLMMQDAPVLQGSVEKNLSFPYTLFHAGEKVFSKARASSLLEKVGLGQVPLEQDVLQLSGGERHRLALVRALLWNPDVILADEPLSGLDSSIASVCFDLLLEFAHAEGKAVLCVMHDKGYEREADCMISFHGNGIEIHQSPSLNTEHV